MPALMLLEHVFGSWSMMSFPMPWKRRLAVPSGCRMSFESSVDDDVLVCLGDATAADQDDRIGRPPFMQRDKDAHLRPPSQPIRIASARSSSATGLMACRPSPDWPRSR